MPVSTTGSNSARAAYNAAASPAGPEPNIKTLTVSSLVSSLLEGLVDTLFKLKSIGSPLFVEIKNGAPRSISDAHRNTVSKYNCTLNILSDAIHLAKVT
jgi:hypothetical protein